MANYKKIFIIFLFVILLIFPLVVLGACRQLEVPIPGLETTCLPALPDYIVAIFNFALMIIGIVCFGALIYGGFRYLTSAGKPAAIADAKDQIFSALLGLIILLSSWLILNTINPELVILNPLKPCVRLEDCPPGQECIEGVCRLPGGGLEFQPWTSGGSSYFLEKECTNAKNEKGENYKWCPACLTNHVNAWETDKCVDPETDCGYTCKIGKCGADCGKAEDCGESIYFYCDDYCKCQYGGGP
jgi:hypothetical protein